jgi:hypothetical protein
MSDTLAMKKSIIKTGRPAIKAVEDLLEYRLPQSGKPLNAIVLTREIAEQLVREWYALSTAADTTTNKDT